MATPHRHATVRQRYHALGVKRVVEETDDAKSIVFDVPPSLQNDFAYASGQFVTLRVVIGGVAHLRSYSMSSAPGIDEDLQVTVKRVPDGLVSNWLNENVTVGDLIEVSAPAGAFVLSGSDAAVVAFAGGSGITPIFSIVKTLLHSTDRRVRLLFANRERAAAIFGDALDRLTGQFPDRLTVQHHEDALHGFLGGDDVVAFVADDLAADFYICGPGPFMDIVETAVQTCGVEAARVFIERFSPLGEGAPPETEERPAPPAGASITITLGNRTETVHQHGRSTILQSARSVGLRAPSSCEAGHCATCMAQVLEGAVEMANNEVLTPEELDEGWILTCQAVPTSSVVRVVYET